jgi:CRP-like cAMP-binding protein
LSHFQSRRLKRHQYLIQAGDVVTSSYWVAEGFLKAYYVDTLGKEHIVQFGMEDWWITDYEAFTTGRPAKLHVDCLEPSELFYITLADREKLCAESHKMANFFREKISLGYIGLQNRILTLLTSSPRERYEELQVKYPGLLQRASKTLIASYLGVSRETLSRLNSKK